MSLEPDAATSFQVFTCAGCGAELAPTLLSCPACRRLVHTDRLKELAETAESAERDENPSLALASWQEAMTLLPTGTRQHTLIGERIARLGRQVESIPGHPTAAKAISNDATDETENGAGRTKGAAAGVIGTLALAVWKFKFLAVMALGKGKLLLLGLTKASTFLSMFAMVGVYWTAFGFWFALGLVLSIYVHEMGHVAALARYGVPASAPLFIPGLGAVIRLRQEFTDSRQDARVALAGPTWGLGAAVFCALVFMATQDKIWAALAQFGAFINLFNLLPIWQLDGGRTFRSFNRPQRWLAATALATAWAITADGMLLLLMLAAAIRALIDKPAPRPDRGALLHYIALVAALSLLAFAPALRFH